jgi:hypothetical protein
LIGAGAGEEQARKVDAGEASRCGADKSAWFEGSSVEQQVRAGRMVAITTRQSRGRFLG